MTTLSNDFVSMKPLPSYDRAPLYRGLMTKTVYQEIAQILNGYKKSIKRSLHTDDFNAASQITYDVLKEIQKKEKMHECHFAMTIHLLESIGFASIHAPEYAKASQGETLSLSKRLVRLQMWGLKSGLWLDKKANQLHQMGVGILVNDVPTIPFEKELSSG